MGYGITYAIGRSYIATDDVLCDYGADDQTASTSWVLLQSIRMISEVYPTSSFRFVFQMGNDSAVAKASAQIFKNGVAVGTLREDNTHSPGYNTFTEDITFTDLKSSDVFELWGKAPAADLCRVRDFTIKGAETAFLVV